MSISITDDKGRPIIVIGDNGRVAVARYPDLNPEYKRYAVQYFREMVEGDWQKLEKFLNFEEDDNEFCS